MKELRHLDVVLKEIMDTATDVAGLAMYQHPFFHGLTLPRRADIPLSLIHISEPTRLC